jgi:hypothetical protein
VAHVALDGLRDVDREVPDAFEVGVDLDRRHDGAEIDRHGLVEREQLEAAGVDFDVQLIDRTVTGEDPIHDRGVPVDQRLDHRAHAFFGQAAHFEQAGLELLQLLLEVRNGLHRQSLIPEP